ncbi:unnamed protein product, partial [marine sediment metagenome]
ENQKKHQKKEINKEGEKSFTVFFSHDTGQDQDPVVEYQINSWFLPVQFLFFPKLS